LRDIASTFVEVPLSNFDIPLYLVLTGENKIEKVNSLTGDSLALLEIPEWISVNETLHGYIEDVKFSNYMAAAREDEDQICLVNYADTEDNICFETGMSDISAMGISQKYRHLYVSERKHEFLAIFELAEIGCGYNRLTLSCGNQFKDFRDDIPNIVCKPGAERMPYFNMIDQCRCLTGYFYSHDDENCQQCFTGCNHCLGSGEEDCLEFVIDS
jgi:hypothetical protein